MRASARLEPSVLILGGNANTVAFTSSLRPNEKGTIGAHLLPIASTPIGIAAGDVWQNVGIAHDNVLEWVDQTFPPEDEHAFVSPPRQIELLLRAGWDAQLPSAIDDRAILNIEDIPEDVAEAFAHPPEPIVQCSTCRRLCVRDHFVWRERQLCAWDYHRAVFGRRGPWRSEPYDDRHFATLPSAAYIAPPLLAEIDLDVVLAVMGVADDLARRLINETIGADGKRSHMAVHTTDGYTLLRENVDDAQ